jgi:hypothetical protein
MTTVVNLRRTSSYDVYVGRAGKGLSGYFGNPFNDGTRESNIERFRQYFLDRVGKDSAFRSKVLALRGKRLGCFCKPLRCHGDVIKAWLDAQ